MSKLTLVFDSSQASHFEECPTFWNYSDKQQLAPALAEPNEPMLMGTYGHHLLDIYYKAKAHGESFAQAKDAAMSFDADAVTCTCNHLINNHIYDETYNHCRECECISFQAKPFPLGVLQREQIKQRFLEYTYTYINNDIVPLSPEHVEVGFSEPIFENASRLYVLEGRLDLLGTLQGLNCVVDHKFQLRPHNLYKKSIQFRNYAMISKRNMLIINYVRLTKGVSKDTLVRDISSFTSVEHEVWKRRLIRIFDRVAEAVQTDCYEQRWDSCSGKYGKPCVFTPLCEQWDKQLIQAIKVRDYVKKEEWKPW